MLKNLAILCVLASGVSGKPNDASSNKNNIPGKQPPAPVTTYTYDSNCCTTQASQKSDEKPHRWYTPLERPDWWILIAAVGTLIVIGWQTVQTRKAADAALLNAKALVDSERPWLIAETIRDSINRHVYEIKITNFGRTPARFIRGDATHVFTQQPMTLPIPAAYSSPITLPKNLL